MSAVLQRIPFAVPEQDANRIARPQKLYFWQKAIFDDVADLFSLGEASDGSPVAEFKLLL